MQERDGNGDGERLLLLLREALLRMQRTATVVRESG